jgi:hypothetical protein
MEPAIPTLITCQFIAFALKLLTPFGSVAQSVEHRPFKLWVEGSSPFALSFRDHLMR